MDRHADPLVEVLGLTTITIKRGATFDRTADIPVDLPDGYFAGWTVTAHVRTASQSLVDTLQCTWLDGATTRALRLYRADTSAWPLQALAFDVRFTSPSGYVLLSESVQVRVTQTQTQEATP